MEFPLPKEHCAHIMLQIFSLLEKQRLCDLVITVEGEEFWVHKCVMAASCPTLYDIIIQETLSSPRNTIHLTLQGLTSTGFRALIDYLYTGNPPNDLNDNMMKEFQKSCHALGITQATLSKVDECDPAPALPVEPETRPIKIEAPAEPNDEEMSTDIEIVVEVSTSPSPVRRFSEEEVYQQVEEETSTPLPRGVMQEHRQTINESLSEKEQNEDADQDDLPGDHNDGDYSPTKQSRSYNSFIGDIKKEIYPEDTENDAVPNKKPRGRPPRANDFLFARSPPFICPDEKCKKVCSSRVQLKKHYECHCAKPHVCVTCSHSFQYMKDLLIHHRVHTGERPHKCELCEASFAQKSTLKNHMISHQKKKELACSDCGRLYSSLRSLNIHKKDKHSGEVPKHPCAHCHKVYGSRSAYLFHLRSDCDSSRFLCSLCGKKYRRQEPYQRHTEMCKGVVDFQCDLCSRKLKSASGLKYHKSAYHSENENVEEVVLMPVQNDTVAAAVSAVGGMEPNDEMLDFASVIFVDLEGSKVVRTTEEQVQTQ